MPKLCGWELCSNCMNQLARKEVGQKIYATCHPGVLHNWHGESGQGETDRRSYPLVELGRVGKTM